MAGVHQTTELMKTKKEKNHMKQSELVSVVLNNEWQMM